MFRKIWKTIKIFVIIIVILIVVPRSLLPKKNTGEQNNDHKSPIREQKSIISHTPDSTAEQTDSSTVSAPAMKQRDRF